MPDRPAIDEVLWNLAVANRILAREGVVDGFGHVSVRHPTDPERYFLSCSRSPGIVSRADLVEFRLDNEPVVPQDRQLYLERPIHGGIYESRPDVMAVVHNHSLSVIPFGLTDVPLRQVLHVAGGVGNDVPIWDIRDRFGDTDLLVRTQEQGRDLARALGQGAVALMRGHGCVVAAGSLRLVVSRAVYLEVNARLLRETLALSPNVTYMTPGEAEATARMGQQNSGLTRNWEYWMSRASLDGI